MNKFCLVSFLVVISCAISPNFAQQKQKVKNSLSIDEQARQQALQYWASKITKCGDDWYATDKKNFVSQVKNFSVSVQNNPINQSDKLNGFQFKGVFSASITQIRTYTKDKGFGKWQEQKSFGSDQEIVKLKGKWFFNGVGGFSTRWIGISCNDATNPQAYFSRLEDEQLSSDVANFKRNSEHYGIYANNLTAEMWNALYVVNNNDCNYGHFGINSAFITANGNFSFTRGDFKWEYRLPNKLLNESLLEGRYGYKKTGNHIAMLTNNAWITRSYSDNPYSYYMSYSMEIPDDLSNLLSLVYDQFSKGKRPSFYAKLSENGRWYFEDEKHRWWGNVSDELEEFLKNDDLEVEKLVFLDEEGYYLQYKINNSHKISWRTTSNIADTLQQISNNSDEYLSDIVTAGNNRWIIFTQARTTTRCLSR